MTILFKYNSFFTNKCLTILNSSFCLQNNLIFTIAFRPFWKIAKKHKKNKENSIKQPATRSSLIFRFMSYIGEQKRMKKKKKKKYLNEQNIIKFIIILHIKGAVYLTIKTAIRKTKSVAHTLAKYCIKKFIFFCLFLFLFQNICCDVCLVYGDALTLRLNLT